LAAFFLRKISGTLMAIQICWQFDALGESRRQQISLLGEVLVITWVGDVIVDTAWQLAEANSCHDRVSSSQKTIFGDNVFQVRLLRRGSAFCQSVWLALNEIPMGQVLTYSELAAKLHSGPRAVAQACRMNPYPGIIPCHRVVSKTGLGGFMGQSGGAWIELKQRLLNYERKMATVAR